MLKTTVGFDARIAYLAAKDISVENTQFLGDSAILLKHRDIWRFCGKKGQYAFSKAIVLQEQSYRLLRANCISLTGFWRF